MCDALGVSRSGYYAWSARKGLSRREESNRVLLTEIREVFRLGRGTYGSPRVFQELRCRGRRVGKNRVQHLMRQEGLQAVVRRRYRRTTRSDHDLPVAPNLLDRHFEADRPNRSWATDITYVWTLEGWLYLAVVIDLFSRRVVGWSMADHMKTDLVMNALTMALGNRLPEGELLHHSDRGSQYASFRYQKALDHHGITCSMSRAGDCLDNAVVESFFGTLKSELIHRQTWTTRDSARAGIHEYIEVFYNRVRRHSTLGYRTPAEFEADYAEVGAA